MKTSLTAYAVVAAASLAAVLSAAAVHAADAPVAPASPEPTAAAAAAPESTPGIMGVPAGVSSSLRPTSTLKSRPMTPDSEMPMEDSEITQQVIAAIAADPRIKGSIDVSTNDGVVRLIGNVNTVGMIYRVIEITERVSGVRGIDENRLVEGYVKPG